MTGGRAGGRADGCVPPTSGPHGLAGGVSSFAPDDAPPRQESVAGPVRMASNASASVCLAPAAYKLPGRTGLLFRLRLDFPISKYQTRKQTTTTTYSPPIFPKASTCSNVHQQHHQDTTAKMVDLGAHIRRGHPAAFGLLAFISLIVGIISAAITADYEGNDTGANGNYTGLVTRVHFAVFYGWWTFVFSIIYVSMTTQAPGV